MCVVLSGVVLAIAFSPAKPAHKHTLSDNKTYHICNDRIYYTKVCTDGCIIPFETDATLLDVLTGVAPDEKIVLDEDVTLTEQVELKSFTTDGQGLTYDINFDLNNHTLSSDIENPTDNNSLFMLNSNQGKIKFNIYNGKINVNDLKYIFRFKNTKINTKSLQLDINDVECVANNRQATPIFAHSECYGITINADNSRFIAQNSTSINEDYGVGVFLNSDSEFNFNNCYFEGGDAVYVKNGTVNLTGCELVNSGLVSDTPIVTPQNGFAFWAVGACLTADSYTTSKGTTQFNVTIENCEMRGEASYKMIYAIKTAEDNTLTPTINSNSIVDIKSCVFSNDPTSDKNLSLNDQIVQYPNGQAPINNGNQSWVCGVMASGNN